MSETLLAPHRDASPEDAQKLLGNTAAEQDQRDAFAAEFADVDIDTDAIIADEENKALEATRQTKLAELNKFLTEPEDRLRGLKAIYGEAADKLTAEEAEAFISDKLSVSASEKVAPNVEVKTAEQQLEAGRPAGVPTIEELKADIQAEGPVKLGFLKRARRLAGAPGRAVWKGYSRLMARSEKRAKRMEGMTSEQREKYEKRANVLVYVATLAIAGAYAATKSEQILNLIPDMNSGSGDNNTDHAADIKPTAGGIEQDQPTPEEVARKEYEASFAYNPDNDPINNPARQEYNFRAALDTSSPEAARADLLNGLKGSPNQLAVFMASEGLIPNDLDSIASMTEKMHADPSLMASNFDSIESRMSSGAVEFVSGNGDQPYGSWYYVDNGDGTKSLAYQSAVYDGQPILMVNGKAIGCNCGQPIDLPQGNASAPVEAPIGGAPIEPVATVTRNFTETVVPPQGGGNYVPPVTEKPPVVVPPVTEKPPVVPPNEQKGNAYPSNKFVTPMDSGEYMPEPAPVEKVTVTVPDRDAGVPQAPIIDTITQTPGAETGGQDTKSTTPLDTSGNPGGSKVQAPETTTTNSGIVGSRL